VEHCERVQIIAASKRICIANCRECTFYLGVNHQPLVMGDNHKLLVSFALPICAFLLLRCYVSVYEFINISLCYKKDKQHWAVGR
jgi:hypothetical protein